ncbi:MAG: sulfurtransferase TusA family protein [Bacillota bacterium]
MSGRNEAIAHLKDGGFIKQRQEDYFAVRVRVIAGNLEAEQLPKVAEIAKRYGRGYVSLTVRQGIEIPWVRREDLEACKAELVAADLEVAGCGPRVRAIVGCKGSVCPYGLVDTQGLVKDWDTRFFSISGFPHKFKIGLAGCPNCCSKPQFNDVGFMARVEPGLDADRCNGCGLCVTACGEKAIKMQDKLAVRDAGRCLGCGDCVRVCPRDAWRPARTGLSLFVGGKFGRHPRHGRRLAEFIPAERAFEAIEAVMEYYRQDGRRGERLWDTTERTGLAGLNAGLAALGGEPALRDEGPIAALTVGGKVGREVATTSVNCGQGQDKLSDTENSSADKPGGDKPVVADDTAGVPVLDLRGELCPYTFIRTMIALEDVPSGGRLFVLLDDGQPIRDVPRSLKGAGHEVQRITPEGPTFRLLVKKDGAPLK